MLLSKGLPFISEGKPSWNLGNPCNFKNEQLDVGCLPRLASLVLRMCSELLCYFCAFSHVLFWPFIWGGCVFLQLFFVQFRIFPPNMEGHGSIRLVCGPKCVSCTTCKSCLLARVVDWLRFLWSLAEI